MMKTKTKKLIKFRTKELGYSKKRNPVKWYSEEEVKKIIDKLIQTGVIEDKRQWTPYL